MTVLPKTYFWTTNIPLYFESHPRLEFCTRLYLKDSSTCKMGHFSTIHENFSRDVPLHSKVSVKFLKSYGSAFADVCALRDSECSCNLLVNCFNRVYTVPAIPSALACHWAGRHKHLVAAQKEMGSNQSAVRCRELYIKYV